METFYVIMIIDATAAIPGNHERGVQAGSELKLQCRILKIVQPHETPPSVKWLHNGHLVMSDNQERISISTTWNKQVITHYYRACRFIFYFKGSPVMKIMLKKM